MKLKKIGQILLVAGMVAALPAYAVKAAPDRQFELSRRYVLDGADKWDYLGIDHVRHRLFVSRASHVQVIDADTGKQVGDILNTDGVHGFAFAQNRKSGFITNGHANTIAVFDLDTLQITATIKAGGLNPDAIAYSPKLARIYVSNGGSNSVSAIDIDRGKLIAAMDIGGRPEALAVDENGRIFVSVEDKNEIVAINGKNNTVLAHWPLAGCDEPSGLALDAKAQRLFAVCSNHRMVVVDAGSGRMVAAVPIGGHPDAAAFDPVLNMAFSSNGEDGTLTVVHEDDPDHYHVAQNVRTQDGARTLALDSATHRAYLATAKMGVVPVKTDAVPHPRAKVLAGTFNVLVVQLKP
jgi:YVTN family beta-propeller protein